MNRWVVLLDGEVPEVYGLFASEDSAERAAAKWNAAHPRDEYGARAIQLSPARDLASAE